MTNFQIVFIGKVVVSQMLYNSDLHFLPQRSQLKWSWITFSIALIGKLLAKIISVIFTEAKI